MRRIAGVFSAVTPTASSSDASAGVDSMAVAVDVDAWASPLRINDSRASASVSPPSEPL
jgi:hypothetical protein